MQPVSSTLPWLSACLNLEEVARLADVTKAEILRKDEFELDCALSATGTMSRVHDESGVCWNEVLLLLCSVQQAGLLFPALAPHAVDLVPCD